MYECMYALHEQVVSYESIRLSSLNNRTNIETTRSKVILSLKIAFQIKHLQKSRDLR